MNAIGSLIIVIGVILVLLLMLSNKAKMYVKNNRELVLSIMYTIMTIMFSLMFLRPSVISSIIKHIKVNYIYILYFVVYLGIPIYFLITTIKSYKEYFKKKNKKK